MTGSSMTSVSLTRTAQKSVLRGVMNNVIVHVCAGLTRIVINNGVIIKYDFSTQVLRVYKGAHLHELFYTTLQLLSLKVN
jgi:hypothetical protein